MGYLGALTLLHHFSNCPLGSQKSGEAGSIFFPKKWILGRRWAWSLSSSSVIRRLSNGSSRRTSAGREIMFFKHLVTDIYHPSFWFSVITFPLTVRVLKISQDLIKLLKDFGIPLSNPFPVIIQSGASLTERYLYIWETPETLCNHLYQISQQYFLNWTFCDGYWF